MDDEPNLVAEIMQFFQSTPEEVRLREERETLLNQFLAAYRTERHGQGNPQSSTPVHGKAPLTLISPPEDI